MKIADMTSADTGGQSYKLSTFIRRYTSHISRSFIKTLDYINFPHDILLGEHDREFVREYLGSTDIVHCHNKYRYANDWAPLNPKAKWIIHQHGRFPEVLKKEEVYEADRIRGAYRIVSTLNLLNYVNYDFDRWLPAPFDLEKLQKIKEENYKPSDRIRIAHSPTRRDYKNTELLIELVNKIPNLELVLIENKTNEESLIMKSTCDITFDQMHLCYGNSGLEGWGFGQAVIVGPTDIARELIKTYIGYEPYIYATPETLFEELKKLTYDADYRKHYADLGKKYIIEYHDSKVVTDKIISIYKKIISKNS
ncbi:MAG TPA: hypothetical protein PK122_00195 [Candidatus Paceibacterota bacterium]|nr:hypothetical protein [Candidatus Paceibacterota bacterium]